MISIIVAQTRNRMIGRDNDFPWHLPNDLKRFRLLTEGNSIVMGRKTFEHILERTGGKLLPGRTSIVITRDPDYSYPDAIVAHSLDQAIELADSDEIFIIGGGQIYEQALPIADRIYLTEVDAELEGDAYFPAINPGEWSEVFRESHDKDDRHDYDYSFIVLERR